jgi:secreted trypsin-like serine protease
MKRVLALIAALGVMIGLAAPAAAITRGGELDHDDHPYVGLMVAQDADGNPLWRCSGSFISDAVYVTAGHCTEAPAASAQIWLASDVESGIPANGYPFTGDAAGTTYTHPLYVPSAFFLYDLGVVVLDEPLASEQLDEFATLPSAGAVDELGHGRKSAVVTAVGYGLQAASANPVKPEKTVAERVRYQADLFVVNTEGVAGLGNIQLPGDLPPTNSMILSGDAKHGGTCFGDSGGPALIGDTLVGVTSFGLNGNCGGIGGSFRIDRDLELGWIQGFLD